MGKLRGDKARQAQEKIALKESGAANTHEQLMSDLDRSVNRLVEAGFERAGIWVLNAAGDGIEFKGAAVKLAGVYAHAVNSEVFYVGSAQRGLARRLRNYAISKVMRTSRRVRGEMILCLKNGKTVETYTLCPPQQDWNDLPVDMIAGLEEGLIRQIKPAWNRRGAFSGKLKPPMPEGDEGR